MTVEIAEINGLEKLDSEGVGLMISADGGFSGAISHFS
jgi:hypothetical protein